MNPRMNTAPTTPLLGGFIQVPVRESAFGKYLDLTGRIPKDATCIMVMLNSGGGLNAGWPKPIGFLRLTHQLYLKDVEKLLREQAKNTEDAVFTVGGTLWVTVAPIRPEEYVDVWSVVPPSNSVK